MDTLLLHVLWLKTCAEVKEKKDAQVSRDRKFTKEKLIPPCDHHLVLIVYVLFQLKYTLCCG